MTHAWEPGDQVILRMIEPEGKLHSVRPVTVVADDGEIAAVQLVAGTGPRRSQNSLTAGT